MQKFSIKNRYGLEIVGDLLIPDNSIGLAVVQHGLGSYKEQPSMQEVANTFYNNNYTVINFDATNSVGESGGKYEDATMQKHYEDLVDVITWSKNQEWYKEPFVLAGQSMGGYAVVRYAEEFPKEVKAIFSYAGSISGKLSFETKEKFEPEKLKEWKETGWISRVSKSKPGLVKRLPWSHMEERLNHDLIPKAGNIICPILIIVGDQDDACPEEVQKVLLEAIPESISKEMHIILGAPHTFKEQSHISEMGQVLNDWLKNI